MAVRSSHLRHLAGVLQSWDTRLRLQQSVFWLPVGLTAGVVAALLIAVAARIWPLWPRSSVIVLGALLGAVGLVVLPLSIWLWPRRLARKARYFDRLFDLKERFSTAVAVAEGALPVESDEIAALQYRDTLKAAEGVRPAERLPLRIDWRLWAGAAAAVVVLAVVIFLPNPQEAVLQQQAEVRQAITEQLQELERLRQQAIEETTLTPEERAAVVETLDEAIRTLEQSDVTQEEALAALNSAQRQLQDLSSQFAEQRQQALQQASGLLEGTAAQQAAEALARGDLLGAAEALQNLDLSALTPEQQQQLAEALEAAAEALSETNPEAAQAMQEAAEALRAGDAQAASEALDRAGQAMAETGNGSVAQVDSLAEQVSRSGSALAGSGQGQSAQPGQAGMGQASAAGQQDQAGQGGGAGRGEGSGEAASGGAAGGQMPTDNSPGDGGETPYDSVYAPQRIGGEGGEQVNIPGSPGAGQPTGTEGNFVDNPTGQASVPYSQVWADYARAVNEALDSGYVPLGLRDLIRTYFSQLDPGAN
jgi:hypothetical protein